MTVGLRLFPTKYGDLNLSDGAYGKDLKGRWWARAPGENERRRLQVVEEHADATITVRGVINGGLKCFALERGVWTDLTGGET